MVATAVAQGASLSTDPICAALIRVVPKVCVCACLRAGVCICSGSVHIDIGRGRKEEEPPAKQKLGTLEKLTLRNVLVPIQRHRSMADIIAT